MHLEVNKPVTERLKVLSIAYKDLPRLFAGKLHIKNIPDYSRIISIHDNHMHRGIDILIEHPSFEPTEVTAMIDPIIAEYVEETKTNLTRKLTFD